MKLVWLYDSTACVDCYMTTALGEPSDDPDYTPAVVPLSSLDRDERPEIGWKFPTEGMRNNPDGDTVLGYSKTPCECCGSTLAGDRYAVSIWTTESE